MINNLLNRKPKAKININKLHNGNETLTNAQDIADSFNNILCNIAQKLKDESVRDSGRPPENTFLTIRHLSLALHVK